MYTLNTHNLPIPSKSVSRDNPWFNRSMNCAITTAAHIESWYKIWLPSHDGNKKSTLSVTWQLLMPETFNEEVLLCVCHQCTMQLWTCPLQWHTAWDDNISKYSANVPEMLSFHLLLAMKTKGYICTGSCTSIQLGSNEMSTLRTTSTQTHTLPLHSLSCALPHLINYTFVQFVRHLLVHYCDRFIMIFFPPPPPHPHRHWYINTCCMKQFGPSVH